MSSDRIEQMKAREETGERRALTTNTLIKIPRAVHFHYFWTAVRAPSHSYKLLFNYDMIFNDSNDSHMEIEEW